MNISNESSSLSIPIIFEGRIDSVTAPATEQEIHKVINQQPSEIILDFEQVDYISSAGLRVLLSSSKECVSRGIILKIAKMKPIVKEVIEVTGFSSLFTFV